jgi:hypothetical protein
MLLAFMTSLLGYVHMRLRIDTAFASLGSLTDPAIVATIGQLWLFRKWLTLVCLATVLMMIVLGAQEWQAFSTWLTVVRLVVVGAFAFGAKVGSAVLVASDRWLREMLRAYRGVKWSI